MKTYNEMNLENLSEEEFITELSLGKVSSTVLLGRLVSLTRKIKDKDLKQIGEVLKYLGYMIYVNSLNQKKNNKKEQTNKPIRRNIVWKHLQDR